jgi:predicted RNA-binding Zn-ribbon protein involved in translation (DUF1610 family)
MSPASAATRKRCYNCGFEAPADDEAWASVYHPSLGTLTQCPECGKTNVRNAA